MKSLLFALCILAFLAENSNSQQYIGGRPRYSVHGDSLPDISYDFRTIYYNQTFLSKKWYIDDKEIKGFDANRIIMSCDSSKKLLVIGSSLNALSILLGSVGVVTLCLTNSNMIFNTQNGNPFNLSGFGVGLSLEVLSLAFGTMGNNYYSEAFSVFNFSCLPELKKKS